MIAEDLGDQIQIRDLPLEGIIAELKDDGVDEIQIVTGNRTDRHVSDTIVGPRTVWLKQGDQPADEVLEIRSENRSALIRFRALTPLAAMP
jgi:hypothetical protein